MIKVVAVVSLGIIILTLLVEEPEDKVVFMDVGQGDAILFQNGTRQVLIDGGPGMGVLERLGEEMPFIDRRLEVVVLTHPQRDHMEGLLHVMERYEVGMVLLPWATNTSQMQEKWLGMIEERGVSYRFAWSGQELEVGEMKFQVLGPFDSEDGLKATRSDLNNASVMMRADHGEMSFLLTGDAEKPVEKLLVDNVSRDVLDVDVYKAGHHGSDSSSTQELLDVVSPSAVVISAGKDNRFGHPKRSVLDRLGGSKVWRTDESGSIGFIREKNEWLVRGVLGGLSDDFLTVGS